ncbi:hypothetical protein SB773_22330 [Bacillus sp. SIMBA_074]|uniref:hypothetical protein n=1 Tax=Bacillus sp. SIMBA_074 TaxID=3085812 RepID=UPI003978C77F
MKTLNKENSLLANLEEVELEEINGGGWKDAARWGADFVRGIYSKGHGCGMGDGYTKGFTGNGNYLEGAYGHR